MKALFSPQNWHEKSRGMINAKLHNSPEAQSQDAPGPAVRRAKLVWFAIGRHIIGCIPRLRGIVAMQGRIGRCKPRSCAVRGVEGGRAVAVTDLTGGWIDW